jgi:hypothetical protein
MFAELMVQGHCENKTLQEFVFRDCEQPLPVYTVLLESFVVNQTVTTFDKASLSRRSRGYQTISSKPCPHAIHHRSDDFGQSRSKGQNAATPSCEEEKNATCFERNEGDSNNDLVDILIDFYLKLNRLGRQIVETPTVMSLRAVGQSV